MCGRYALYDISKLKFKFNQTFKPNYNISPSNKVLVINSSREIISINWTLKFYKSSKLRVINARSESLDSKFFFKNAQRCIFIANGYFEWKKNPGGKIPYFHTLKKNILFFAGIMNSHGACIVTRQSYSPMDAIHDRQPLLLKFDDFDIWFEQKHNYKCEFAKKMRIYRVSKKINNPKNNEKDIIERF